MGSDPVCKCMCLPVQPAILPGLDRPTKCNRWYRTNLTDATRAMIKRSTEDVKKLASWPSEPTAGVRRFLRLYTLSKTYTLAIALTQSLNHYKGTISEAPAIKDFEGLHNSVGGIPANSESLG